MSMLELDVKLPELDGLVKDLGLEEGGRAQQHLSLIHISRVCCRSFWNGSTR